MEASLTKSPPCQADFITKEITQPREAIHILLLELTSGPEPGACVPPGKVTKSQGQSHARLARVTVATTSLGSSVGLG